MKVGDLVKTFDRDPYNISYSGIIIDIMEPKDKRQTSRAVILTTDGEIRTERMIYNLLEKVKET